MAAAATVMQRMTARRLLIEQNRHASCLCNKLSRKRCYATPTETPRTEAENVTHHPHKLTKGRKVQWHCQSPP